MTDRTHRPRRGTLAGLAAACLVLLSPCAHPGEGLTISVNDQRVSVKASAVSRREILEALATEGLVDIVSAETLDQRVDFDAGPLALGELLRRLLRQHSYMYVRQSGTDRLWILASSDTPPGAGWQAAPYDVALRVRFELTDPDPEVRLEAVLYAADLPPSDAMQLLASAIYDPEPSVRDAAEAVLESLDATDYPPGTRPRE